MDANWHTLSNEHSEILADAIDQRQEFTEKLAIFRSGLLHKKHRWLQLTAHDIYDQLSKRELTVLEMRTLKHTFPVIADALGISVSSAKTYWRRCLAKCTKAIMSTKPIIDDE